MLEILESLPEGLLELEADELHTKLKGPTLIHIKGRRHQPLFVSVLMHGNETTGWVAIRSLLQEYAGRKLPRSLSLFIGNVEAARYNKRYLEHQPDYNRVWKHTKGETITAEHAVMQQVAEIMREREPFASIDIHNNTGLNPHYACITTLQHNALHLAAMFSRTVVYFTYPDTVQCAAFAKFCPSITVECGQPGHAYGQGHAREFLDACLRLSELPQHTVSHNDVDLFHTVAVAKVPEHVSIGFNGESCDLNFVDDIDYFNFRELPADTTLAQIRTNNPIELEVRDAHGEDVSGKYFRVSDGELRTALPVMPSMLCRSVKAIRQDCLCYLMERHQEFLQDI